MTSVTLVRRIAARPSIVFDAVTTAEGMASWWGPDNGPVLVAHSDVRVGGAYCVRFRTANGDEHEARGEYLELVRPERVVMSFRWAEGGVPEEVGNVSRIEMILKAVGDETELVFTHARLCGDPSKASHEQGWSGAIDKLVGQLKTSFANR
jgi:uncharacterized protein YndB with AHSA1/START domain